MYLEDIFKINKYEYIPLKLCTKTTEKHVLFFSYHVVGIIDVPYRLPVY